MTGRRTKTVEKKSRAVSRLVEPGLDASCAGCGDRVKFVAKRRSHQVIANIYVEQVWNRVEHFHHDCYRDAGQPYGPAR